MFYCHSEVLHEFIILRHILLKVYITKPSSESITFKLQLTVFVQLSLGVKKYEKQPSKDLTHSLNGSEVSPSQTSSQ